MGSNPSEVHGLKWGLLRVVPLFERTVLIQGTNWMVQTALLSQEGSVIETRSREGWFPRGPYIRMVPLEPPRRFAPPLLTQEGSRIFQTELSFCRQIQACASLGRNLQNCMKGSDSSFSKMMSEFAGMPCVYNRRDMVDAYPRNYS